MPLDPRRHTHRYGCQRGVGAHAAQAGYALGASVIGITSSEEKKALLEQWPWLTATLMGNEPWEEIVAAMTDDLGADAALDTIGSSLGQLIACLRHGGVSHWQGKSRRIRRSSHRRRSYSGS